MGIVVVDTHEVVISCNEWLLNAANLERSNVIGHLFLEVFPSVKNKRLYSVLREVLDYGRPAVLSQALNKCPLPLVLRRANADDGPMQQAISILRISREGASDCCLIQVTDVTPMVARERKLRQLTRDAVGARDELQRQTEQLDDLNLVLQARSRDLANFAHAAAHDLKAPMRHMAGLARILQEDCKDLLEPASLKHLDMLVDAGNRGARVVEDLLRFAEAQRPEELSLIKLNSVFDHAVSNLRGEIEQQGAKVSSDELGEAMGYETGLMLVFQNLIGNALKYCTAAVPEVSLSSRIDEHYVEVRVADNGVGVPEADREAIFEPFRRAHQEIAEGSGIGLATVRRIVEDCGGTIWVEPIETGSVFIFTCLRG